MDEDREFNKFSHLDETIPKCVLLKVFTLEK